MANGYGRGGVQRGGGGGTTVSQAYGFMPKEASSYLTGQLGEEYRRNVEALGAGIPESKYAARELKKRKTKIGRLRDIAAARASGDFLGFAHSKARASKAYAGQGLLTGQTYGVGEQATAYKPGGALSYRAAMGGTDPRVSLGQTFQALGAGTTSPEAAFGYEPVSKFKRGQDPYMFERGSSWGPLGMFGGGRDVEDINPVLNPEALYYGGAEGYKASRARRSGGRGIFLRR